MDTHRCRFVPYPPSAINALAFSHASAPSLSSKGPQNLRLAIGRANGDIEIWNPLRGVWYQESVFRGGRDRSIEGLAWIQDPEDVDKNGFKIPGKLRLFSIGYSSAVTEWDLASGQPLRHSAGNYGEIWCMAAQPRAHAVKPAVKGAKENLAEHAGTQTQSIAVGCADGSIVLLNSAEDDLRFSKILARPSKKKSRVLSVTFQNRHIIIAGHADSTIRIFDIRNIQQTRMMTLGAGPKGGPKETLVWSVKCLGDGTIVSGDSTGTLSFWDGKNYTLLQRIKSHDADILDVAVSADGESVFSGGMDRRTTLYKRTASQESGQRLRWGKLVHQRFHKHDVKAMATFETKTMSILASGGLDTTPIIIPIKQFGREYQRTLSNLPQQPIVCGALEKRYLVSWWNQEISVWYIPRSHNKEVDGKHHLQARPEGRKLVAKIALKGEEWITSVELTPDGLMLVVSTMADLKFFQLKEKSGGIKVQKFEAPLELSRMGARSIHISPDNRWLAIHRTNNSVQLHRIMKSDISKKGMQIFPKAVNLRRLPREPMSTSYQHGTLGDYNRAITRLDFSAEGRILAVADISGFIDTWVLEGQEDLTLPEDGVQERKKTNTASDVENSDEDSDTDEDTNVIFGQRWIRNPAATLLIKLPAAPLILSFRPMSEQSSSALTNGNVGVHPTRHTPHPHSHDLPQGDDRLFVLTAENHVYEFNVLSGKISDWSRRNPSSCLPLEFRELRDRAMGAVWDVQGRNERIWLYGVAWLWMFDISRDLPAIDHEDSKPLATNGENPKKQLKRKRGRESQDDEPKSRSKHDTGAGSKIDASKRGLGIGPKIRKIDGEDNDTVKLITLGQEHDDASASDEEEDNGPANQNVTALQRLRRNDQAETNGATDDTDMDDGGEDDDRLTKSMKHERPSHWHTFKYRPILGIVPLGGEPDDESNDDREDTQPGLEVALVERPLWDLDLPLRFHGNQEWDE